jgi:hypothetical protein
MAAAMGDSDKASIIERLFNSEPFNNFPELKVKLLEE